MNDRDRLKVLCRRLVRMGSTPLLTPQEIDDLDDVEADRWIRIEIDRLALISQMQTELQNRKRRSKPQNPQHQDRGGPR
jgi:hypothetical protein